MTYISAIDFRGSGVPTTFLTIDVNVTTTSDGDVLTSCPSCTSLRSIQALNTTYLMTSSVTRLTTSSVTRPPTASNTTPGVSAGLSDPPLYVVVKSGGLRGRLGNHMFIYAALLGIARAQSRVPILEEGKSLAKVFRINHIEKIDTTGYVEFG